MGCHFLLNDRVILPVKETSLLFQQISVIVIHPEQIRTPPAPYHPHTPPWRKVVFPTLLDLKVQYLSK